MIGRLTIFDANAPAERTAWRDVIEGWSGREPFAHPVYVALFAAANERALCAYCECSSGGVLFPFVLRPIANEAWAPVGCESFDAVTPYGYGGPFAWGDGGEHVDRFWEMFVDWLARERVVTLFARLALFDAYRTLFRGPTRSRTRNVVCDLGGTEESIWRSYDHKVRKNVNRARSSGITVTADPRGDRLSDFLRIYQATMDRRKAREGFYFPQMFFERLRDELPEHVMFFHAERDERVISTELVLVSDKHLYSFLGGTDSEEFRHRPNDLLKHEIILWGKRTGRTHFVLGGGYGSDDGIFRYKRAFCPAGVVPFSIGTLVVDAQEADDLVRARREFESSQGRVWSPDQSFFPAYRA